MIARLVCLVFGHKWVQFECLGGALTPAVPVTLPRLCWRCGKMTGTMRAFRLLQLGRYRWL